MNHLSYFAPLSTFLLVLLFAPRADAADPRGVQYRAAQANRAAQPSAPQTRSVQPRSAPSPAMYAGFPLVKTPPANPHPRPEVYEEPAPPYLILRTPRLHTFDAGRGWYPADPYPVSTQAYAYGWFGAQPRHHWTRHFGYHSIYTEWRSR